MLSNQQQSILRGTKQHKKLLFQTGVPQEAINSLLFWCIVDGSPNQVQVPLHQGQVPPGRDWSLANKREEVSV
jgi:hypothetical protein